MYNIAIRADGSSQIGMGHIMRCLSLAKALKKIDCKVYFFSKYDGGIEKIRQSAFDAIKLESQEAFGVKETADMCQKYVIDALVVDSYEVTENSLLFIKDHVKKLAYIDDINKFIYPVDILINGNITGEYMGYEKYSSNEMLLLGPRYNLIREEFKGLPLRNMKNGVSSIMLTTGGSDPHNISEYLIEWILSEEILQHIKINVVVGSVFAHKESLRKLANRSAQVVLHENVQSMSKIMLDSDIAISAGGSTLYELCACGTPTLAFIMADNQELIVEKMDELRYIESLGWYNKLTRENFINTLQSLIKDVDRRKNTALRMQNLVDGKGSERCAREILNSLKD